MNIGAGSRFRRQVFGSIPAVLAAFVIAIPAQAQTQPGQRRAADTQQVRRSAAAPANSDNGQASRPMLHRVVCLIYTCRNSSRPSNRDGN
jgi:hypothetical protein